MSGLAPLLFAPRLVAKIWGGRRLASVLDKRLPAGRFGEAWEISAYPGNESTVAWPPEHAGKTLPELAAQLGGDLLGPHHQRIRAGGFPLLYKFIDAEDALSVQVHPDDEYARAQEGASGKTECWVIIASRPGSLIYRGFKSGSNLAMFDRLLAAGRLEECLHAFPVSAGDVVFLPAGTVHAIGAGILLAELQQSSDLTYRVYDWGRLENGRPRTLHLAKAREVMSFAPAGADKIRPAVKAEYAGGRLEGLVSCEKFALERLLISGTAHAFPKGKVSVPETRAPLLNAGAGRFSIISVLAGDCDLYWRGGQRRFSRGDSLLLPAALEDVAAGAAGEAVLLNAFLPC